MKLLCRLLILLLLPLATARAQSVIITYSGTGYGGYSGDGAPAIYTAFYFPYGLVSDSAGNIYVADTYNGRVRKISPAGVVTTIAGTPNGTTADGYPAIYTKLSGPVGLALDAAGNLYVAEQDRVRRINNQGIMTLVAGSGPSSTSPGDGGPATSAYLWNVRAIIVDGAGNLYISEGYPSRIRKVTPGGIITTFAGKGTSGFSGDGGPATQASLNYPGGLALDGAGNLYVADTYNGRIRKIASDGIITTFAGGGTSTGDGVPATSAQLLGPNSLLFRSGNLYIGLVSFGTNSSVVRVDSSGNLKFVAGQGTGGLGDGGLPSDARLAGAGGLAFDPAGRFYIADTGNNRIRRVQLPPTNNPVPAISMLLPSGVPAGAADLELVVRGTGFVPGAKVQWNGVDRPTSFISDVQLSASIAATDLLAAATAQVTVFNPTTGGGGGASANVSFSVYTPPPPANALIVPFAGTGYGGHSGDGGSAAYTSITTPRGLAFDSAGDLLVSEYGGYYYPSTSVAPARVRRISRDDLVTTVAGGGSSADDAIPATAANLETPISQVVLDPAGNVYFTHRHRVRKVSLSGTITTVAGTGVPGFSGDGGPAAAALLDNPVAVAIDSAGNLYIADADNYRVRKVTPAGTITTIAGNGIADYLADSGPATLTPLGRPVSLTLDTSGNLYVGISAGRLRKLLSDGTILTIAGATDAPSAGSGPALAINLAGPSALVFDGSGNLYFNGYSRVYQMNSRGFVTTFAGTGECCWSGDGGLATQARIQASGLAIDVAGRLYISDENRHRIRRVQPPGSNHPAPILESLVPRAVAVGYSSPLRLVLHGQNFVPGAIVRWNGNDRPTTYLSPERLEIQLETLVFTTVSTHSIAVFNPTDGGGGGLSSSLSFAVVPPPAPSTDLITTVAGNGLAGYSGPEGTAIYAPISNPGGLALDVSGNLYVAESANHIVRRINPSGQFLTLAGNGINGFSGDSGPASDAMLYSPADVALGPDGAVYVADTANHRVRKISTDGTIVTVAGTGTSAHSGDGGPGTLAALRSPQGLAFDSAGNLYISDTGNHRIRKLTPQGVITTFAGNGIPGFFGDGGPAIQSPLHTPRGLAFDGAGNLYIADSLNHRIRRVSPDGVIRTVAGYGESYVPFAEGRPAIEVGLNRPADVTVDASGNLYIADTGNRRVLKVDGLGMAATAAGLGSYYESSLGDGGLATGAYLYDPISVAVDSAGVLYVSDGNYRIRRVQPPPTNNPIPSLASLSPTHVLAGSPAFKLTARGANFVPGATVYWNGYPRNTLYVGPNHLEASIGTYDVLNSGTASVTVHNPTAGGGGGDSTALTFAIVQSAPSFTGSITPLAGTGTAGFAGDGGAAATALFNSPRGIVVDSSGNIFVADTANGRVRRIDTAGIVTTIAGGGSALGDGGPATDAELFGPVGLALDAGGNLFVADSGHSRIRKVTAAGIISTVAGTGVAGFSGDGGPATAAQLSHPAGVEVDATGNLFIADTDNHRIRKVNGAGTITTIAGNGFAGYFGDGGLAIFSPLNRPTDVAVDSAGGVFIADSFNSRVRRVTPGGVIELVAGAGSYGTVGDGGPALFAQLYLPQAVALDAAGNLYVAVTGQHRVRRIDPAGIISTLAGTGFQGSTGDNTLATGAQLSSPAGVVVGPTGNIYIADTGNHRVRVLPASSAVVCSYDVSSSSFSLGPDPSEHTLNVVTASNCPWTATASASWITITGGNAGSGPGTVNFKVSTNILGSRTGTLLVGGRSVTVVQSGMNCGYSFSPWPVLMSATGGPATISVVAPSACPWTATTSSAWIAITSGSAGSGNGTVAFTVAPNPGAARNGQITFIQGSAVEVKQAGSSCVPFFAPAAASLAATAASATVSVNVAAGCPWTAASNASWLTILSGFSGSGAGSVSYAVTANDTTVLRTGTLTIAGLTFSVTQAGIAANGTVTAAAAAGPAAGTARIPVTLQVNSGLTVDSVSFGLSITPVESAPAISTVTFNRSASMPAPTTVDTAAGPGLLGVSWLNLPSPLAGTVVLGEVVVTIPATATAVQTYTVNITGASGSLQSGAVPLAPGLDATLLVTPGYLVGDAAPSPSAAGDLNGDSRPDNAGEFGDGVLDNLDLIGALRTATNLPGYTAPACSDRFDAMDAFPLDTQTTRGGDGTVNNLDLIATLRRLVNIDSSRPARTSRGLACTAGASQPGPAMAASTTGADGALQFLPPEMAADGTLRIPIYLNARRDLALAGLSLGIGLSEAGTIRFAAGGALAPSIVDSGVSGNLAIAWLDGLFVPAGTRTLLGYLIVEGTEGVFDASRLVVFGAPADSGAGQPVRLVRIMNDEL